MKIIDANIILRFFLNDHPRLSAVARDIFSELESGQQKMILKDYILAEVIYVSHGFYALPRKLVAQDLIHIVSLKGFIHKDKAVLNDALKIYANSKFDFADCLLAAEALNHKHTIITFDKKLDKLANKYTHA